MKLIDAHFSHTLIDYFDDYAQDYHEIQWKCTVCEEAACKGCPAAGTALAAPCIGFSWLAALHVTGPDGITRTVKKSGTGWPEGGDSGYAPLLRPGS